jgi:hypothetical protein
MTRTQQPAVAAATRLALPRWHATPTALTAARTAARFPHEYGRFITSAPARPIEVTR